MRVRWNRESLRLRITPSEFEAITQGQPVQESLAFPGGHVWNVTLQAQGLVTSLASNPDGVAVLLSESDCERLAEPEAEGVYFRTDAPPGLRYYVEKDFPCVHKPAPESGEGSAAETFTPPSTFEVRKLAPTEINGD